ncbi:MAG: tape measure protein [Acidobacteria bacterium]|nr:tape measure protein [Acidobacteriota bacterium]
MVARAGEVTVGVDADVGKFQSKMRSATTRFESFNKSAKDAAGSFRATERSLNRSSDALGRFADDTREAAAATRLETRARNRAATSYGTFAERAKTASTTLTQVNRVQQRSAAAAGRFADNVNASNRAVKRQSGAAERSADLFNVLNRRLRSVSLTLERFPQATQQTETGLRNVRQEAQRTGGALSRLPRSVRNLAGAFVGLQGIQVGFRVLRQLSQAAVKYADINVDVNNRIRLVTEGEERLAEVRQQVGDIARATRNDIEDVAILYSRLSLALQETAISASDIPRLISIISQQAKIGGATATELRGGLIQLSQGFASGRLQGDELRSVFENLQGVTYGLTDGFRRLAAAGEIDFQVRGVGDLRRLAEQGLLTPEILARGFLASEEFTAERFEQRAIGILESFTLVRTASLELADAVETSTGVFSRFGAAIRGIADEISVRAQVIQSFLAGLEGRPLPSQFSIRREDIPLNTAALFRGRDRDEQRVLRAFLEGFERRRVDEQLGRVAPAPLTIPADAFRSIEQVIATRAEDVESAIREGTSIEAASLQRLEREQVGLLDASRSELASLGESLANIPALRGEDGQLVGRFGLLFERLSSVLGTISVDDLSGSDRRLTEELSALLSQFVQAVDLEVPEINRGFIDPLLAAVVETVDALGPLPVELDSFRSALRAAYESPLGRFFEARRRAEEGDATRASAQRELNQREFSGFAERFALQRELILRFQGDVLTAEDHRALDDLSAAISEAAARNAEFLAFRATFRELPEARQAEFQEEFDQRRAVNDQQLAQATGRLSVQFDRLGQVVAAAAAAEADAARRRVTVTAETEDLLRQLEFLEIDVARRGGGVSPERVSQLGASPELRAEFLRIPELIAEGIRRGEEFRVLESRVADLPPDQRRLVEPAIDRIRESNRADLERVVPLVTDAFEQFLDALRSDRDAITDANRERIAGLRQTEDEQRAYDIRTADQADARRIADRNRAEAELEAAQQRRIQRLSSAFSQFFSQVFTDIDNLSDAFRALLQSISGTLINEAVTSIFASFGGGRQFGGPVYPSGSYLVGERGPELFVPDTAGTIVPNSSFGPSFAPTFQVTVTGGNAEDNRRMLMDEFLPYVREVVRQDWLDSVHRLGSPEYQAGGG